MKIVIYGATEIGCLLATEFFEDHDITIIDKEEFVISGGDCRRIRGAFCA